MKIEEVEVEIEGMHCISCASSIEKVLQKVPGVKSSSIDYAMGLGTVQVEEGTSREKITQAIKDAGFHAEILDTRSIHTFSSMAPFYNDPHFFLFFISFLLTLPLLINMAGDVLRLNFFISPYAELFFATIVQFWCGKSLFHGAYSALKARSANMDLLIVLGSLSSYLFSCFLLFNGELHLYFETGSFIITVVLFGRWIEGGVKEKAQRAVVNLLKLRPKKVHVERMGEVLEINPLDLKVGELFFIRPGEVVAVDGTILSGNSSINEESIFGEKNPTFKQKGDPVYAGTVNFEGLLKAKAEKIGSDTILEHIIERAKKLHTTKAPIQRFADQAAEIFVPTIIVIAALVFLAWWIGTNSLTKAFMPAVATLLIACPCAIGMATPITLLIASGLAARFGLIFHDASTLEIASKIKTFVFDKTGTITEGIPAVKQVLSFNKMGEDEILQILASIEAFSTHPIANSIIQHAKMHDIVAEPITHIQNLFGRGILAQKRGELYFAGSLAYAKDQKVEIPLALKNLKSDESVVVLIHNHTLTGAVLLEDIIRPHTKEVVRNLQSQGIEVLMISGDKQEVAESVASRVGITKVFGEVLPDKKVDKIMELKAVHKILGMCGDGINDAFALSAADVGFSMASGSDFAIESSDVTLMKKDLRGIIDAIEISKATIRKVKQNLFLASIYNIVAIPIAALGFLNPMVAATAMVASSLSVVINALLLKKWKPSFNK